MTLKAPAAPAQGHRDDHLISMLDILPLTCLPKLPEVGNLQSWRLGDPAIPRDAVISTLHAHEPQNQMELAAPTHTGMFIGQFRL